jgi:ABC-2 type transport system permease protein
MPGWAQMLGEVFPLTHFLRLIRAVMLKGAGFGTVSGPMLALAGFVLLYGALALSRFRRTLD